MSATHVVTRRFSGPGSVRLEIGAQVDAADWPNAHSLVKGRYLRPIERPPERISAPRPIDTGKRKG